MRYPAYVLYETLGPTLPDGAQAAAALWGLAHRCAMTYPDAVRRAGHADGEALFDAILAGRSGISFTARRLRGRVELRRPSGQPVRARDRRAARRAARARDEPDALDERRVPARPVGRRAPLVDREHDLPRPGVAQARRRRRAAHQPRGRARLGLADGGRARVTTTRGSAETPVEISDAMLAGPHLAAERPRRRLPVRGRLRGAHGRRAERAHFAGVARPARRHAMAQACAGARRGAAGLTDSCGLVKRSRLRPWGSGLRVPIRPRARAASCFDLSSGCAAVRLRPHFTFIRDRKSESVY